MLLASIVILVIGLALSFSVTNEQRISVADRDHRAALYVAEQALKQAETVVH